MTEKYPLSICMVGAVSAGAYSAGVMSVLLEALRLCDDENAELPHRYKHRVKITGMPGASAGLIQAVLSSFDMFAASDIQNLGKDAWLNVTIQNLLTTTSLEGERGMAKSALNPDVLTGRRCQSRA